MAYWVLRQFPPCSNDAQSGRTIAKHSTFSREMRLGILEVLAVAAFIALLLSPDFCQARWAQPITAMLGHGLAESAIFSREDCSVASILDLLILASSLLMLRMA